MACNTCMAWRYRIAKKVGLAKYKRLFPNFPLRPEDEQAISTRAAGSDSGADAAGHSGPESKGG